MSDVALVRNILGDILIAIGRIERRFEGIDSPDDFIKDDEGIDRLDGITMMLIAIGEQLKRLDKEVDFDMSVKYPEVDWKGAKGIRDFLSHNYFAVDAEIIFDTCENKLESVKTAILDMRSNLS